MHNKIFLVIFGMVFAIIAVVFDFFPRSTFSHIEKRALDPAPEFSLQSLFSGEYTRRVSHWFSDTEPFRNELLTLSMGLRELASVTLDGDDEEEPLEAPDSLAAEPEETRVTKYVNTVNPHASAKLCARGIIVVGTGSKVRGINCFRGEPTGGKAFAHTANLYKETFGDRVNVYCMPIPNSAEFYCPDKAQDRQKSQLAMIRNVEANLAPGVKAVDAYSALAHHVRENIYLRTDHHWSPLGAYYAARAFAKVAGVDFPSLEEGYNRRVVHGFVGSMFGYSHDIAIKQNPEDFVYYVPKDSNYVCTVVSYKTAHGDFNILSESGPYKVPFFRKYPDGSGGAYCTFMGGDCQLTVVRTGVKNGRRLMIMKDSFGNALPGYLFYSFEEIHIVDFRYNTRNMKQYVPENKITDILFAFNTFNAYNSQACQRFNNYLTLTSGTTSATKTDPKADTKVAAKEAAKAATKEAAKAAAKTDVVDEAADETVSADAAPDTLSATKHHRRSRRRH